MLTCGILIYGGASLFVVGFAVYPIAALFRETDAPKRLIPGAIALGALTFTTTAGTGSEVTRFTIITDEASDEKMLCAGIGFMPLAALIDYDLTLSLPARTTADTGIDAFTHAIEAYVSRKANPYSDSQAIAAMRLIGPTPTATAATGQRARR
ncbi:hypothetical protein GCM10027514_25310 [Azotobacter armeniacus]